jgi:hypothetical protein
MEQGVELYTDLRYVKNLNGLCPAEGQMVFGNTRAVGLTGQQRIPSYSINTATPYECYMKAAKLIDMYNNWLDIKDPTPQQKIDYAMLDTYKRDSKQGTVKIQGYSASFYVNRATAPFSENCHIEFGNCLGVDENSQVLTVKGGNQIHASMISPCTIPFKRSDCLKSKVSDTQSRICTWTTAENTENPCFEWLKSLPESQGIQLSYANQTEQANLICQNYPDLPECDCIARNSRRLFNNLSNNFKAVSDICWYLPCKLEGYDRQITPSDRLQRANCKTTVCQNILNVLDSSENTLNELKQSIACSKDEWEKIPAGGAGGQNNTNPDDPDDPESGIQAWVIAIIVTVVILIGIGALIYNNFVKAKNATTPTSSTAP